MNRRRLWLLICLVFGGGTAYLAADWYRCLPEGVTATYVGRGTCMECHTGQDKRWEGSHHAGAMALATPETVQGNFNNATYEQFGVKSRMFREGDKFLVETEGRTPGKLETFTVKYTFGVSPLQQYLVEFPDGRLQVLPLCWDVSKQEWFHIYPNEPIRPGDPLHWTGFAQTWNHMCAECHSTNVHKNYDVATNTYHTAFSEINVSCESCHGPGSTHVDIARSKKIFWDRRYGYGLPNLKAKDPKTELDTCAHCHANHSILHGGFQAGDAHDDFYRLGYLDEVRYHPDGQIQDEVFEYGSFQQSLMYRKGVRCTDCHDPHTAQLKAEGNNLCTRCHVAAKYDTPAHHHHLVNSTGSKCVECHMPTKNYMVVHARRDHNLRIPRPDLSEKLGTPNACNNCHRHSDKSSTWSADYVTQWFGPKRRDDPHYGETIYAARLSKPQAERPLAALAKSPDVGPIVRATALALLGQYPSEDSRKVIERALAASEPIERAAAIASTPPDALKDAALKLLNDPSRVVRFEAFQQLLRLPEQVFTPAENEQLRKALDEYLEGRAVTEDLPQTQLVLGEIWERFHDDRRAEAHYRLAMRNAPSDVGSRQRLGDLLARQGKLQESEQLAHEAVTLSKQVVEQQQHVVQYLTAVKNQDTLGKAKLELKMCQEQAGYSLMCLARFLMIGGKRNAEASDALGEAISFADLAEDPVLLVGCGQLLRDINKIAESHAAFEKALRLRPDDPEIKQLLNR